MLLNRKQLMDWLKEKGEKDPYVCVYRKIPNSVYIPTRYEGIYKAAGTYTVWDDVGGVAADGFMWRPINGGTILYEIMSNY